MDGRWRYVTWFYWQDKKRGFVRKDVVFSQNPAVLFPLYMFFFALALFLLHTFASVLSNYARYWRFRVEAL